MATEPKPTTHGEPGHAENRTAEHGAGNQTAPRAGQTRDSKAKLEADKKRLQEDREERAKQMAEREKHRGTPTPTQEEADLIKLGHHPELANDGSGPDPADAVNTVQHIGAKPKAEKPGEYPTRQMSAKA